MGGGVWSEKREWKKEKRLGVVKRGEPYDAKTAKGEKGTLT